MTQNTLSKKSSRSIYRHDSERYFIDVRKY